MDVSLNDIMNVVILLDQMVTTAEQNERELLDRMPISRPLTDAEVFVGAFTGNRLQELIDLHDRLLALIPEEML